MTERENFFAIARRAGYERMSVFHVKHFYSRALSKFPDSYRRSEMLPAPGRGMLLDIAER